MSPPPLTHMLRGFRGLRGVALAITCAVPCLPGCARSAEERQLDDMRAEIDRIQDRRDREEQSILVPEVAASEGATTAPLTSPFTTPLTPTLTPIVPPMPADQDSVTLGGRAREGYGGQGPSTDLGGGAVDDDAPDTDDPTPRPNLRVFGSARSSRGSWRADQVEQTFSDDGPRTPGPLDPAAPVAYDAAMALVNAKQYDRAIDAFAAFLVRWPDHPYANNAMYWRGECYFAKGDYARASDQFEGVIARFPAGAKAPDALLKLGMSHQKLGEPIKAKESFDRLTQLYPQSEAARRIPPVTIPATTPRGPASEDHR